MKRTSYILLSLLIPSLASCNLEEQPVAQTGKDAIFENEEGLVLYTNSLYDTPPSHGWRSRSAGYGFGCFTGAIDYFNADYDGAANAGQLYYGTPRACNYFLENNTSAKVPESVRNNYNGIARYFLANWYAYMVLAYSDIPLVDHVVDVKETDVLYGPRDPRTKVAEFVYDNYKYALDNIAALYESSASTITKNVVAFQMAKYCLYEGSWRKYHSDLGLGSTANEWFQRAVDAAEVVINSGKQSLHSNWGEIFTAASPETVSDEGIFIYRYGQGINSYHNTTKCENSPSFLGGPTCKSRYLVNMFLNADGSRFTDNPNYESMNFIDECKNRDPRFAMTFRTPTYMRTQTDGTRHHAGLEMDMNYNGYMSRKFCSDNERYDNETDETTCMVPMRYSELLLIWAEAKCELGNFTDADWAASVGAIRRRAGITGGLTTRPTVADPYLANLFKHTSDPVMLEIIRERFIELMGEGHEKDDIYRWADTGIISLPQYGIWIEGVDRNLDLDGDGVYDTYFYTGDSAPADAVSTIKYRQIDPTPGLGNKKCLLSLAEDGHRLVYNCILDRPVFNPRCYYSPISTLDITLNPNLKQTPGW